MELHAIRARLQEGIERNGISDMKEVNRVSTTKDLKVLIRRKLPLHVSPALDAAAECVAVVYVLTLAPAAPEDKPQANSKSHAASCMEEDYLLCAVV